MLCSPSDQPVWLPLGGLAVGAPGAQQSWGLFQWDDVVPGVVLNLYKSKRRGMGAAVKGTFTLALYIAIGIPGAAFGQAKNETVVPMTRWVPPPPIERYEDPPPAILPTLGVATPMVALPPPLERVVVMTRGNGGRIIDHRMTYEGYFRAGTKVELRGPCYFLCIAEGAFMAFHAVPGMERKEYMEHETWLYYLSLPRAIRLWINGQGSLQNLPMDGYWTMYDRDLWAMGYPRCK